MKSVLLALPLTLSLSASALASETAKAPAPPTTFFAEDPVKWATPKIVVPPTYPPDALQKGVKAEVNVTLNLKADGTLGSIAAIQSEPKLESFESAVTEVLKFWTFEQSLDRSCGPVPAQSRVKIWFEIKEGQPSISVTHMPLTAASGGVAIRAVNRAELFKTLLASFPLDARRSSTEADVYAKLSVDPRNGVTQAVEVVAMRSESNIFQRPTGSMFSKHTKSLADQFSNATHAALMKARFEPGMVEGDGPISVCYLVKYKLGR